MFSASEMNQALVKAFNISVCYNNIINTNLKVQNVHRGLRNKDHIVISFDKSMDADQCMKYLDNMKGRIVETFCGNESTASLSFDMKSFPFNFNRSQLVDSNGKYRFSVPIDQSIVFNLKCLLANGLARDITGAMGRNFGLEHVEEYTSDESFDRKSYLYCMRFYGKRLQEYFIESFSATVKGYKNSPKRTDDFLKVKDNCVYIKKSLFDKTKFINEIEESQACLIGRDLQTSSSDDPAIGKIKYLITGFIRKACPPLYYAFHTSYSGNNEDSILVPIVSCDNYYRFLTKEEVDTINSSFGMVVLNNIESYTLPKHLPVFGSRGIYGIDFSNKEISHCVITKIIKNSVINKDHELAIDPELPRTLLAEASQTQEFPKRSRGKGLERPPRQESEIEGGKRGLFQLVPEEIDSSQSTCGQSQLSLTRRPPSILSPRAWDSSTFLNSGVSEDSLKDTANICNKEPEKQQVTKEKEEEKLFKALLYWFNLSNYALDPPHTSFIVKNGKIASLIDDGVDVKEYLQEIIDKTKEEYRVNKEEAYDFNEFPFQFLSNCEKNQETTVVANISRGALLNLKELFSREHEGKVEIKDIDINIVEKAVKSEKDKWVNFQVQEHGLSPKKAIKTCYPDESVLEYISITKDKGGYWINRDYDGSEVELFRGERWPAKDKSKAEKMKPEDNKDSGYSSGFVTDAENVSSKAEATTSGYESMDCKNTRGGSPKRKSPEPLAGSSTTRKTRSESDSSSFEGGVGSPRPGFSGSTIEQVREQLNKTGI
ncbi:hypothetical protein [Wolbachia endosymbiont of Drosophila pseudotakahashii]|uniref:hypothetical protein n=1 Tax=Wolbachia endosymbiont of Drosophila pseudotakahashii TaxID=375919 RepID=UPI00222F72F2|nr:hypothetical protein [Wolbachia endosymbiont of Drosophila pseudotakahashii]MCX3065460.1 hypothetical protein [Wolbachia endosymbiont of Drosophila pseudotakahashii]UZE38795.1 hypothetical protein ONI09_01480 [Wolbachia endosymbiont of Drosophila pseudotakahashii]